MKDKVFGNNGEADDSLRTDGFRRNLGKSKMIEYVGGEQK